MIACPVVISFDIIGYRLLMHAYSALGRNEWSIHCCVAIMIEKFGVRLNPLSLSILTENTSVTPRLGSWIFFARSNDLGATTLAMTVWHLWDVRNSVRNREKLRHPYSPSEQIKSYIEMILQHLFKPTTLHRRETLATHVWSPPPEGMAVVNVDAALFSSSSWMGVGVVIRNHNGTFLTAHSQVIDEVISPEIA
jgi:hypothetical protein